MSGTLANGLLAANTKVQAHRIPTTGIKYAAVSVMVLNTEAAVANVKIYISATATPAKKDMVDIAKLSANGGKVTVNCNCLSPGDYIVIESDINGLVYRVEGVYEEIVA